MRPCAWFPLYLYSSFWVSRELSERSHLFTEIRSNQRIYWVSDLFDVHLHSSVRVSLSDHCFHFLADEEHCSLVWENALLRWYLYQVQSRGGQLRHSNQECPFRDPPFHPQAHSPLLQKECDWIHLILQESKSKSLISWSVQEISLLTQISQKRRLNSRRSMGRRRQYRRRTSQGQEKGQDSQMVQCWGKEHQPVYCI